MISNSTHLSLTYSFSELKPENVLSTIIEYILTACHSLTKIEGEIIGDPLEIETFLKSESRNGLTCGISYDVNHITNDIEPIEENSMQKKALLSPKIIQS